MRYIQGLNKDVNKCNDRYTKAKQRCKQMQWDIQRHARLNVYHVYRFNNKRGDKLKIKWCINQEKCLHFTSMNSRIIIFPALLE